MCYEYSYIYSYIGKHFPDESGLAFYYLKIGFLEYLQLSGEILYPNAPIGY